MTKKLLLGLGTITAVAAPVATVVACGSDDISITRPATKGSHAVTYTLVLPEATSPNMASDILNAFSSIGGDTSFINDSSLSLSNDVNESMQSIVNFYYSIGIVTQTVKVSIANDATPPTVISSDPIDFSTLIDVDEMNNIKTTDDVIKFTNHMTGKMNSLMNDLSKYYVDLFSDTTFIKWKNQLIAAGVDVNSLPILAHQGENINVGSTVEQVKAFIEKLITNVIPN